MGNNTGQTAFTIVGTVVGAYFGYPQLGYAIGSLAGQLFFPTQLPQVFGPRIDDLSTTSVQLGTPIPYIFGTVRVPGFAMYLGCPEERSTTTEISSKGSPEQKQTTYSYYQTLGMGLCEEIDGLLRVWENGELKYDIREQQEAESDDDYAERLDSSSQYAANFVLYLGDEAQEPDPTMEAELGVGNVPGYRGLAWIMFPNRQLLDAQARRHPQFFFEVYKAVSIGRDVVYPTNIEGGSNDWQLSHIVPNWSRNRYYVLDLTGTMYLRVYSIIDNTEIEQVLLSDILGADPTLGFEQIAVGIDSFIYMSYFTALNALSIVKIDPTTYEIVASNAFVGVECFANCWLKTCMIRQYGSQQNTDYLLTASLFGDGVVYECTNMTIADVVTDATSTDYIVCPGPRDGTTSYGYLLGWKPVLSGSGPAIRIHRLKAFEELVLIDGIPQPFPNANIENDFGTVEASDIDPTWTRFTKVTGAVFDDVDDTIIFGVDGDAAVFSGGGNDRLVKWDPDTLSIVWISGADEPSFSIVNSDDSHGYTRLRGTQYAMPVGITDIAIVDTRTGEMTIQDWSGDLSNNATGEEIYDSGLNAILTFIIGAGPTVIYLDRRIPGRVSIADIIRDVWGRCAGDLADISVVDLEEKYVLGYQLLRATGRGAIEPLRPLGPFDGVESEGLLKFPTRGKPVVANLTADDLGVFQDGTNDVPPAVIETEKQDVELPMMARLRYIAYSRDYEPGEQLSPTRFTGSTINVKDVEIPAVLSDDQAAQAIEIMWAEAWLSRWQYETSVDIERLLLDPADCVTIPFGGRNYRLRIIGIDDSAGGLLRKLQLLKDDDGVSVSTAVADPPPRTTTTLAIFSGTGMILLDLPPLRDEDDDPGVYVAVYRLTSGRAWNGAVINRSSDAGATYAALGSVSTESVVGTLAEPLDDGITTSWDTANEIVVDLFDDDAEFASTTEDDVLSNKANGLAIGAHGRWEIVQFKDAVQEGTHRWRLSNLLRGRRATEHNVGGALAGDFVVSLSHVGRLPLQISDIGSAKLYRAVTIGATFASGTDQSFAGDGEALMPFSPVHIAGARDGSNDLTITWTRRGRIGQELPSGADIPLSEESEEYEVEIVDQLGSPVDVLRTITGLTDADVGTTYTAAQQTTDGLTPGDAVSVRVYQVSATVGRGHAGEATV